MCERDRDNMKLLLTAGIGSESFATLDEQADQSAVGSQPSRGQNHACVSGNHICAVTHDSHVGELRDLPGHHIRNSYEIGNP
jgi:hypothetical protein